MKLMNCPVNGPRPVSEFAYWGELRKVPDAATCSDEEWADYVFNRNGSPGIKQEWWCHTPSNSCFNAAPATEKDRVIATRLPGGDA